MCPTRGPPPVTGSGQIAASARTWCLTPAARLSNDSIAQRHPSLQQLAYRHDALRAIPGKPSKNAVIRPETIVPGCARPTDSGVAQGHRAARGPARIPAARRQWARANGSRIDTSAARRHTRAGRTTKRVVRSWRLLAELEQNPGTVRGVTGGPASGSSVSGHSGIGDSLSLSVSAWRPTMTSYGGWGHPELAPDPRSRRGSRLGLLRPQAAAQCLCETQNTTRIVVLPSSMSSPD